MISQNSTYHSRVQLTVNSKSQKFNEPHKDLFSQRLNEIIDNHLLTEHKVHLNLILLMQVADVVIKDIDMF